VNTQNALEPFFVGSSTVDRSAIRASSAMPNVSPGRPTERISGSLRLLTALEMQALVVQLTGFYHPGFGAYERLIGVIDTQTGQRVPQGLSTSGALALRNLAASLGQKIVAREFFLDESERVVFRSIDLSLPFDESFWRQQLRRISTEWFEFDLSQVAADQIVSRALEVRSRTDGRTALADFLATLLQHVGLYLS
jgi:hypothetical protein